jgi:FlaA1/EpsC-like NDP-sugar epimerase
MDQVTSFIATYDDPILITGACGFIGTRLVEHLLTLGFRKLRCFVRPSSDTSELDALVSRRQSGASVELLSSRAVAEPKSRTGCGSGWQAGEVAGREL